jgi:ABC-type antimicrobial peptide transport system permease subunit
MTLLLQGIALAVLLAACANVASLQLARMLARRKEFSVRTTLGADRGRIVSLAIAETLALMAMGTVVGIILTRGGHEIVRALGLDRSDEGIEFVLDGRVALFTAAIALLGALAAALTPLVSVWRTDLSRSMNDVGRFSGGESRAAILAWRRSLRSAGRSSAE